MRYIYQGSDSQFKEVDPRLGDLRKSVDFRKAEEENKEIEVSFKTDKQLWADLNQFCRKKTKQLGSRVLIKTVATNSIRDFLKQDDKFYVCLGEYKSLKRRYKMLVICFWAFNCILLVVTLLAYLCV